jgi:hypothetical protein
VKKTSIGTDAPVRPDIETVLREWRSAERRFEAQSRGERGPPGVGYRLSEQNGSSTPSKHRTTRAHRPFDHAGIFFTVAHVVLFFRALSKSLASTCSPMLARAGAMILVLVKRGMKCLLFFLPKPTRDHVVRLLKRRLRSLKNSLLPNDPRGDIITRVPCVIRRSGCYRLAHDLVYGEAEGTAIEIDTNDVTIDLQGHALRNSAGKATCATGVGCTGVANVAVLNGTVTGFRYGIVLRAGKRYRVTAICAEENLQWGLSVEGDDCVIRDNVILDTGGSTATCSEVCIAVRAFGARQTVERNVISGLCRSPANSEWVGIHFDSAPDACFKKNIIAATEREARTWGLWVNGGSWGHCGRTNVLASENVFINLGTAGAFVDFAAGNCHDNLLINLVDGFVIGGPDARLCDGGGNVHYVRVAQKVDSRFWGKSIFTLLRPDAGPITGARPLRETTSFNSCKSS